MADAIHPPAATTSPAARQATASPGGQNDTQAQADLLPELDNGEEDAESSYGASVSDGGTSVTSSVLKGYYENGRRYQSTRGTQWNIPSDDKQFESMNAGHLALTALESLRENPYFRSPISKDSQHILDLGTGTGIWANDVADLYPGATIHGVDLFPPPTDWVAPNCILEVDDISKPWTWPYKFDLVHMRLLLGSLPRSEFQKLYRRAYLNLQPGGWIEHVDVDIIVRSNDTNKPLPEGSLLGQVGQILQECARKSGNAADITDWMREEIEAAGFQNVEEKLFKLPIGDWPQHPVYKEAGRLSRVHFKEGLEGWMMYLLTKYGSPNPWSQEEVAVYAAKLKQEVDQGYHIFEYHRRVCAQKPLEA